MIDVNRIQRWMKKAGRFAKSYFYDSTKQFDYKLDNSIVTEADLLIENYFRDQIKKYYPGHTIIGEEMEVEKGYDYAWIIDPIDGSAPFLWNIPTWCISIGITKEMQPFMGFVYVPLTGDFFHSVNSISYLNGKQIRINECQKVDRNSAFCVSSRIINEFSILDYEGMIFSLGSGVFNNMMVARGSSIGAISISPNIWDLAAAALIVESAGGKMVYLDGKTVHINDLFESKKVSQPVLAAPEHLINHLLSKIVISPKI